MNRTTKLLLGLVVGMWAVMFVAPAVYAITEPTQGSFAYDVYDIAVNKILKGPIGFVSGAAAVAFGAVSAMTGRIFHAVPCILGGAALLKADAIVTSLGLLF
ncbi:MAG: hypothetical protein QXQ64_03935 [Candidatus Bathyarchaeia archaeon]